SLYEIAKSIGCEISRWTMDSEKDWDLDLNQLVSSISPQTKVIIINFPHNPTGGMVDEKKFTEIIDVARNKDLYIFSDEVYRFLEFEGKTLPPACDLYDRAVSLGVMSKAFGLAGLRIGWIATRDKILDKMAAFKDYTTICNSTHGEFLAELALRNKSSILERNLKIISSNLKLLDDFFKKNREIMTWNRPKAGSIAFPRLKNGLSSSDLSRDVLADKGVMLLPGKLFDYGDSHFRIGYGRKSMPEALMQLDDFLSISDYLK
ncbi:MAG: aminotransferase class I/II-fold pyridoxal phosphate-dependent enzyme, partial [Candidatus Hodarchaeales archaeon]